MNKPIAYSGVDYPINQLSSDRRFEKLLHRIFEYRIKDDLQGKFDKATLMQGGSERGRDILLQLAGKKNGVIQCKMNTSGNLSKENVSKEIIKFALYYYQDNSLVDDLESFVYYFVCSDKFTGSSIELLVDFKSKILEDEKLEKWIKSILGGFSAFKNLVYKDIESELKDILSKLIVKPKTKSEINGWLQRKGYENVVKEFFEVRTVYVDKVKEDPYNERFQFLKQRYNKVEELKKAIFSYYPSYGTNINNFKEASTFDELFDILQREKDYLNCILKEMGKEVDDLAIDCKNLKRKSESSKEINKIIVRIDSPPNNLKDCQINGYIGFSSESFDAIENFNEALEFTKSNHSQILSDYIDSILHGRSCAKIIELQLLLPNQLFKFNFEIKDKRIRIIKRLLSRIENHEQLEEDEIRFWKRNSDFYHNHKFQKICKDSICSLDENELSDFREDEEIDEHICVISDECLSHSVQDIYNYGITIVLYPYNNSCTIINTIDFKNKPIRNIKNMIFKFMKNNQETHFIYDDYYDVDFLKHESKVEGTDDDYL